VYLCAVAPWRSDFVDEMSAFNGRSNAHDDQVDAFVYALSHLQGVTRDPGPQIYDLGSFLSGNPRKISRPWYEADRSEFLELLKQSERARRGF
jgi:hypothetical protein